MLLGFVTPALLLADFASRRLESLTSPAFVSAATNSLMLAAIAAVITVGLGVLLAYAQRVRRSAVLQGAARLAAIGYAVPGTILAVGILVPLAAFDNMVDGFARETFGFATGLLLHRIGRGAGLCLRDPVPRRLLWHHRSGFRKDLAASRHGRAHAGTDLGEDALPGGPADHPAGAAVGGASRLRRLHEGTAGDHPAPAVQFRDAVDHRSMRRPSHEVFEDAALPALAIVLVGLIPVVLLARTSGTSYRTSTARRGSGGGQSGAQSGAQGGG